MAGVQVGHAEPVLGRGLGLVLVILVRAVKGRADSKNCSSTV